MGDIELVAQWNCDNQIGTIVNYYEVPFDPFTCLTLPTRSEAYFDKHGDAVIELHYISNPVPLKNCVKIERGM